MKIQREVRKRLLCVGLPIISVSLKPMDFGKNIVLNLEPSEDTMLKQIIAGLEASEDFVFLCEHDVLYDISHFVKHDGDKFYFNTNVWKLKWGTNHVVWTDDLRQLSGVSGKRDILLKHFKGLGKFNRHYEPRYNWEDYKSEYPNVDIRHGKNLTMSKWSPKHFKNKKYAKGWKESIIENI